MNEAVGQNGKRILGKVAAAVAVLGIGAGALWYVADGGAHGAPTPEEAVEAGPPGLVEGGQYWIFVSRIQAFATDPEEDAWDTGGSAPDLYYELWWQGNRVFESDVKEDTLIGQWTGLRVQISLVRDLLTDQGVPLEELIAAGTFAHGPDCALELRVYDDDTTGDDRVGVQSLECGALREGRQTLDFRRSAVNAIDSIELYVLPLDTPVAEVLTLLAASPQ